MIEKLIACFRADPVAFSAPVMVTGAGGCIGSWIIAMLHQAGIPVIAMDLKKDVNRLRLLLSDDALEAFFWETGDITDTGYVFKSVEKHKPQAIIHLAALQIPFCAADPILGARVNVVGHLNIMEAARKFGIDRIAYASSVAAYGLIDSSRYLPTLYGAYKLCNENVAEVYVRTMEVPSIGLRPSNVYGVGRDQGLTSKTTLAILAAAAGKPYTVPFSGNTPALYTAEVAAAFIKAVSRPAVGAEVFNINGPAIGVEGWMDIVRELNPNIRIDVEGNPLPFPFDLSDDPLRQHIGDYGSISVAEGTQITFEAFQQLLKKGLLDPERLM